LKKYLNTLPNAITLANLSLGVIAILMSVNSCEETKQQNQMLFVGSLLIIFAALTDRLDGQIARLLNATSDLGKELDSLSDLISFGVAPVTIAWRLSLGNLGIFGYIIALIFPLAGAYRLARYNITEFDNIFRGIPITVAGVVLSLMNLYYSYLLAINKSISDVKIYISAVAILALAILMISKIRFKKI